MNFESLVGTTGIASSFNILYVVDNQNIVITDQYGESKEVHHDFDWISSITTSDLLLFGIYGKEEKCGIFSMDMTTHFFKMVPVAYTPVNLFYINKQLTVLDSEFKEYVYERNLALKTGGEPILTVDVSLNFMTIGFTGGDEKIYFSKGKDVYDTDKNKLFSVEGDVLSLLYYKKNLFVIFNSLYNHYSILQYDLQENKPVKTVDGGYISGPPVYSCIYGNDLYISASTNNLVSLELFNLSMDTVKIERKRVIYPMFELNKINQKFLTDEVKIDTEKLKRFKDAGEVDTTLAQNNLIQYYVWVFIFIFIITIMILAYFFKENSLFPAILLTILFIAISYVIKNRYFI